ncbi:SpaH/EbpB family LPXTG-anchored major pilin [Corynebacterium sp. CCM 9185]|uniref:SpaH/EbpB family LPXTG-anchored major pilin n=1 Tax=Corynebacterium marambiense TaxID=2765364 RepID=A0ABS0VS94_9CORY|nr:SpaH/EbpB family LPXTG-anchored major pilin [Corynebacterium marambiense]MBI8999647.1 SpaH/EbpB family LPXTG-anchored major pilin [Corynebacterium marambiense]MCK7662485.1 SpaH/EbpB family LPXTG-anchored major pilin [Corynebacterium marambiense]
MQNNKRALRAATQAIVVAMAVTTASIGAPAALAVRTAQAQIDATHDVSLTIKKRVNAYTKNDPTGKEDTNVGGTPLAGVTFELRKIRADINTAAGFKAAAALTPESADTTGSTPITKTTGSDGTVVFSNTDLSGVGAYVVTETDAPEGVVKTDPFIVFLPMTDPANLNSWNYDVVAYPKNTRTTVTKEIVDGQDANAGDIIKYKITTARPPFDKNRSYLSYFAFEDQLPDELKLTNTDANKVVVKIGTTTLTESDDYVVKSPVSSTAGKSQDVAVEFTNAGLIKLRDAGDDDEVSVLLPATVQKIGTFDGKTANEGTVSYKVKPISDPSNPGGDSDDPANPTNPGSIVPNKPTDPAGGTSPKVPARWANIKINKVSEDATKLAGAEFKLYRCTDASTFMSTALTVGGQSSWTTEGSEGSILIESVRVPESGSYKYCLEEVKAPEGHELLVEPIVVEVTDTTVDSGTEQKTIEKSITNLKSTSSKLPATGGAGVGLLMALGASILGLGAFAAKRSSRKS